MRCPWARTHAQLYPVVHMMRAIAASQSAYRADIDGLRGLAVLAVVLYHAFPNVLPGGFVGVDIFFVISGYLISKIIWDDLATQHFSLKLFYMRRVRRIFPALTVVLLACLAFGWVILTPVEYAQLAKHIVGGAAFVANLVNWSEAGYFDVAADTKPLLHLWSLGVEEQFYLAFPLLLIYLWKKHSAHTMQMLWGLVVASLCASVVFAHYDSVADFYSPFTRLWELMLGALLAQVPRVEERFSALSNNAFAAIGVMLMVGAIVGLSARVTYPGAWALLPTLGAVALIMAGGSAWLNRWVFAASPLVAVGLISFPLYLWHWPLLSFARIMLSDTPPAGVRIALVLAAVVLAGLTYLFIERPVRSGPLKRRTIAMVFLGMVVVALLANHVRRHDGFASRKLSMLNGDPATLVVGADKTRSSENCGVKKDEIELFQYCFTSSPTPRSALLGDSKADALYHGLARESSVDAGWTMIGSVYPPGSVATERQLREDSIALQTVIANPALQTVVWLVAVRKVFSVDEQTGFFIRDPDGADIADKLRTYGEAISQLERAGKQVWFVLDNPTFPDPRSCISGGATDSAWLNQVLRRIENPRCTLRYSEHLAGTRPYRQFVQALQASHPNLHIYDPAPLLCDIAKDECKIVRDGQFLYSYGDHISDVANSFIAKDLLRQLSEAQPASNRGSTANP